MALCCDDRDESWKILTRERVGIDFFVGFDDDEHEDFLGEFYTMFHAKLFYLQAYLGFVGLLDSK